MFCCVAGANPPLPSPTWQPAERPDGGDDGADTGDGADDDGGEDGAACGSATVTPSGPLTAYVMPPARAAIPTPTPASFAANGHLTGFRLIPSRAGTGKCPRPGTRTPGAAPSSFGQAASRGFQSPQSPNWGQADRLCQARLSG